MQGIGSTVAEWHPCRAILAGTYLYILESESAHTYQRCIRYCDPPLPAANALIYVVAVIAAIGVIFCEVSVFMQNKCQFSIGF
jgi:hypothetical protein